MQSSLTDYPEGSNDQVFTYWALNDVATSLFIQGEAFRKANKIGDALEAYKKVANDYVYGQTWDTKGWFWKPSEAAKEKIAMIESGSNLDFGDYSSAFLTTQAWKALGADDSDADLVLGNGTTGVGTIMGTGTIVLDTFGKYLSGKDLTVTIDRDKTGASTPQTISLVFSMEKGRLVCTVSRTEGIRTRLGDRFTGAFGCQ